MGAVNNLNAGDVAEIWRAIRALQVATPLNSASIGAGGLRVYDGGVITIENGGLSVTGTATITGTLQADGTIAFTGAFNQSGPTTFTGDTKLNGPTHINGATDITGTTTVTGDMTSTGTFTNNGPTNLNGATKTTGTLSVEGVTTLKNDLNVTGGGKINAGNVRISPSATNGGIEFISGGGVGGNGGTVVVKGTGNAGLLSSAVVTSIFSGASQLTVGDGYVTIDGLETVSGVTSNLYMDPSTRRVKRIV